MPECLLHSDISIFETILSDFESQTADYWAISRIQDVTDFPRRCLKARLKVL